jgi:hypothetical protein
MAWVTRCSRSIGEASESRVHSEAYVRLDVGVFGAEAMVSRDSSRSLTVCASLSSGRPGIATEAG